MFQLMRELFRMVPEVKGKFYLSAVFKMIETCCAVAPYGILILTLNDLLVGELAFRKVFYYTAGVAICFLLQGVFYYCLILVAHPIGSRLCERIRIIIGEHLRKLPMGYFADRSAGNLNALVSDELMMLAHTPTMIFPQVVTAVTLPIVFAPFLFLIDWRMAAVTLGVIPLSLPFFFIGQRILRLGMQKRSASLVDASSTVVEYVQGMDVVKSFKQTGRRFQRLDDILRRFKNDNLAMALRAVPILLSYKAVLDFGFSFILLAGAYLFLGGALSMYAFLVFMIIGLRIYEPIKYLALAFELVRINEVAIEKIKQLLAAEPLPQPAKGQFPGAPHIEFKNVTFRYDRRPVLQDISFTIPEKSITALVGPSGAGKTTITNLIARFWDVKSGEIRIGGCNIKQITTDDLLSMVTMVFQDVYLFNDTIRQNIAYGSKTATMGDIINAAKTARCHDFIMNLPNGYDTMVGEGGSTLSGGEKQRISIARAILKDAPIILLDEATASIDPENEHLLQEAIHALVKSKTLIVIAHRLSTITSADQIIVLNEHGSIAEKGSHQALLERDGLYSRLWESRQKARGWKVLHAN